MSTLFLLVIIISVYCFNIKDNTSVPTRVSLQQFSSAKVTKIIEDKAFEDSWTEGLRIGSQFLQIEILSGKYKGEKLETPNYLSAYYNIDAKVGSKIIVKLDKNKSGNIYVVSVFNYDRLRLLFLVLFLFVVVTIIVGGMKGLRAIVGLIFTFVLLWFLLLPMIIKGYSPIYSTIFIITITTIFSLTILNGFSKKTLCSIGGCIGGVMIAGLFTFVIGKVAHINGFNMEEAESIVLLASDDGIKIKGLLVCSILISSLGAVMDIAMSITSSMHEIISINGNINSKELFFRGMNVGHDAMGTMTNTLILAFVGASFNMLILFRIYNYPTIEFLNSNFVWLELIKGIAGSIGIILSVPLTAYIGSRLFTNISRE